MNTGAGDELVRQYLLDLEAEAQALPADRRADLVADITDHVHAARAEAGDDEDAVRSMLARLGSPRDIVASAGDGTQRQPIVVRAVPGTGRELAAVLLLTVGSVIVPLIGWIVGVALLWGSPWWRRGEKWLGTLVWPGGSLAVIVALSLPASSCTGGVQTISLDGERTGTTATCSGFSLPPWLGVPAAVVLFGAPVLVGVLLYRRAKRRAVAAENEQAAAFAVW
jgi:hypothetical protein